MPNPICVVSTVGTSLLPKRVPQQLEHLLRETANLTQGQYTPDQLAQVDARLAEATAALDAAGVHEAHTSGAEPAGGSMQRQE
ncbi:MAG TPA: hypothetical protein VGS41_08150 [Chthonomonadales bacterium]|nr:hypothetical protein [Chthonomonadales bacterium]